MQTVGLEDELRLTVTPDRPVRIDLRCDHAQLASDQSNLVYRAAQLVLERAGQSAEVSITLTKRIPLGAGLGGGSSDAAATILGLAKLLGLSWSGEQMAAIGQRLGSDVPFFFVAPTACVTGRGEHVRPVRLLGRRWITLVNPGFPVETKRAYQQLVSTRAAVRPLSGAHRHLDVQSEMDWSEVTQAAENDFETPVFARHPVLADIKRRLLDAGAEVALLSGSGATMFGVFREQTVAERAAALFVEEGQMKAVAVPTAGAPVLSPA